MLVKKTHIILILFLLTVGSLPAATAKGPGGKCSINIEINKPAKSTITGGIKLHLYLADSGASYDKPIVILSADSGETGLSIGSLPGGTFDAIVTKQGCFPWKISNIVLSDIRADISKNIPDLLETTNEQSYIKNKISIIFKMGVSYKEGKEIISNADCSIKSFEPRYNEKSGQGDEWVVVLPNDTSILGKVNYFNNLPCVYSAFPVGRAYFSADSSSDDTSTKSKVKYKKESVIVIFKQGVAEKEERKIISGTGSKILNYEKGDSETPDNRFGDLFLILTPDSVKASEIVDYLSKLPVVFHASPENKNGVNANDIIQFK